MNANLIQAAQRAFLSPLEGSSRDGWITSATRAVHDLVGSDHTVFFCPRSGPPSCASGLLVWSCDTDPVVTSGYEAAFTGTWEGGRAFGDPLLAASLEARQRGGSGVYHEADLTPRSAVEASPFYQEVLRPHGVCHVLGLSALIGDGSELSVMAAFERSGARGFGEESLRSLRVLVPAFEAGARAYARFTAQERAWRTALADRLDALDVGALMTDASGAELHWNPALVRLLGGEQDDGPLLVAVRAWVDWLTTETTKRTRSSEALPAARVRTPRGVYRVHGAHVGADLLGERAVLVTVEPPFPLFPPSEVLRERFNLTRRECAVALLLAEGRTDPEVADALHISWHTARHHAEAVLEKLALNTRAAVAVRLMSGVGQPP